MNFEEIKMQNERLLLTDDILKILIKEEKTKVQRNAIGSFDFLKYFDGQSEMFVKNGYFSYKINDEMCENIIGHIQFMTLGCARVLMPILKKHHEETSELSKQHAKIIKDLTDLFREKDNPMLEDLIEGTIETNAKNLENDINAFATSYEGQKLMTQYLLNTPKHDFLIGILAFKAGATNLFNLVKEDETKINGWLGSIGQSLVLDIEQKVFKQAASPAAQTVPSTTNLTATPTT